MAQLLCRFFLCNLIIICFVFSCDSHQNPAAQESRVSGFGSSLKVAPIPPSKSAAELVHFGHLMTEGLKKQTVRGLSKGGERQAFTTVVLDALILVGGLPRSQLTSVLKRFLMSEDCGGVSCGLIFRLKAQEVESFLDDLAASLSKKGMSLKDQNIVLGSLRKDEVAFTSEFLQETVRRELGIYDRQMTYDDLKRLKTIPLPEGKVNPSVLFDQDLELIPHVTLEFRYQSEFWLKTMILHSDKISSVALRHLETSSGKSLVSDIHQLFFLKDARYIQRLSLDALNLDKIETLSFLPPSLNHLEILQVTGEFNDAKVFSLNKLKTLNSLSLTMDLDQIRVSEGVFLSPNISKIQVAPKSATSVDCDHLSGLAPFRKVRSFSFASCFGKH